MPALLAAAPASATSPQAVSTTATPADNATQLATVQILRLEEQVQAALVEARHQQEQMAALKQRLADAEAGSSGSPWLLLGLALLGALSVWLAWRMRQQRNLFLSGLDSGLARLNVGQAQPTGAAAMPAGPPPAVPVAAAPPPAAPPAPVPVRQHAAAVPTPDRLKLPEVPSLKPMPPVRDFALATGVPPRPVSVEELLDLEQQVDFFLVLGQHQSAIDLLLSHVRETGSASAAPYLRLMEIYREQGDQEAFERTRERFNKRFNAMAPDWQGDLGSGRTLEDYPDLLQRLQRGWSKPMRAAAEVDAVLLRREGIEPFDLPAYRELLLLHAVLMELPAAASDSDVPPRFEQADEALLSVPPAPAAGQAAEVVDLLLPLGESPTEITSPRPHLSQRTSAQAMLAEWVFSRSTTPMSDPGATPQAAAEAVDAATGKLDLDLSDYATSPREFTEPAAFTDIGMGRDSRLSDLTFNASAGDTPPRH